MCAARAAPQSASGSAPAPPARGGGHAAAQRVGGVRSLADIAKSDEDTDEDDHNEYYAGGEKSGQARARAPLHPNPGPAARASLPRLAAWVGGGRALRRGACC